MKKFTHYDMNRGKVKVHVMEKISKREAKRLEEKIQQEKFKEEHNKLIFGFRIMYFTTIIIEYFILRWWFK